MASHEEMRKAKQERTARQVRAAKSRLDEHMSDIEERLEELGNCFAYDNEAALELAKEVVARAKLVLAEVEHVAAL